MSGMARAPWALPIVLTVCGPACSQRAGPSADAAAAPSDAAGDAADAGRDARAAAPSGPFDAATEDAAIADAASLVDGAAVLHSYRRVLHIGDSMVGFKFGLTRALGRRFEADGAKFFSIPVTSAGIQSFEKGTDLDLGLKKTHPDLVLLTLGANNATSPAPEYLIPAIKRVVKKVGVSSNPRRRCIWIGPPLWQPDKVGFIDVLRKSVAPCAFFDSSGLDLERMADRIHPTNKGGEVWADAVMAFIVARMAEAGE